MSFTSTNMLRKKIVFGLGSNIGNRKDFLDKAISKLVYNLDLKNIKKSKILENKALLLPGSPANWNQDFFNMAVSADIDFNNFPALIILEIIKKIEMDLGRVDRGKWSPREIDIDILAINEMFINIDGSLIVPHAELFNRDFFFKTFFEIEPELFTRIKSKNA